MQGDSQRNAIDNRIDNNVSQVLENGKHGTKRQKASTKVGPAPESSTVNCGAESDFHSTVSSRDEMHRLDSAGAPISFAASLEDVSKLQGYATVGAAFVAFFVLGFGSVPFTLWGHEKVPVVNELAYATLYWIINVSSCGVSGFLYVSDR